MKLENPLSYLDSDLNHSLNIDKYIINASGDDFYVPDNSRFYYDRLPEPKSLRVVPNASQKEIFSVAEQSLITVVNRFQEKVMLPQITQKMQCRGNSVKFLTVIFQNDRKVFYYGQHIILLQGISVMPVM